MRSSKQRQRNKQNRPVRPSGGNVVNRVFDSSGPEGKVRGTPAQIIEKYTQLHRDAQLGGDRVAAENFAQHAEHYTRMLAEAQRDIDRVRDEQDQWNRERQAERDRQMEQSRDRQGNEPRHADHRSNDHRSNDQRNSEPRNSEPRNNEPRYNEARTGEARGGEARGGEARSGDGRANEPRGGEGRTDPRDGQRAFEPRPERSFDAGRDRQPRFRGGRDDAPAAHPVTEPTPERSVDEGARGAERRDEAAPDRVEAAHEDRREHGSEPSFLRQPLFPILVAEPEDDRMAQDAGPTLVETPESRAERLPEPRRRGPRREPRPDMRPEGQAEPRAPEGPELALAEPASADAPEPAAPRAPRARRPRKPRAEGSAALDVAPDAAE